MGLTNRYHRRMVGKRGIPVASPMTSARSRPKPGPKPRLSRTEIIDAAINTGLDRVTMQGVAERLNTSASALYRYYSGRDELVLAAMERLLAGVPIPTPGGTWRQFLLDEAELRWQLLTSTAGLSRAGLNRLEAVTDVRMTRLVDALLGFGFEVRDAVLAVDAVLDLVHDGAEQTILLHQQDPDGGRHLTPALAARLDRCPPAGANRLRGDHRRSEGARGPQTAAGPGRSGPPAHRPSGPARPRKG